MKRWGLRASERTKWRQERKGRVEGWSTVNQTLQGTVPEKTDGEEEEGGGGKKGKEEEEEGGGKVVRGGEEGGGVVLEEEDRGGVDVGLPEEVERRGEEP